MLRDGGDYDTTDENGYLVKRHFDGHLFDEVVFNDSVQEFIKKRLELADYFTGEHEDDIFTYILPQRTNQIFTPKRVVKDMVDKLEKENPGCFDNPDATFADLYMKSGMYITEIVARLYQSNRMKALYPDDTERLNHIFASRSMDVHRQRLSIGSVYVISLDLTTRFILRRTILNSATRCNMQKRER